MKTTRPLSLFAVVVLVGCAAGGATPPETGASLDSLDAFCAARAKAECNDTVVKSCKSKTKDACVASRTAICKSSVPQGVRYDADAAGTCIDAVTEAYADAKLGPGEITGLADVCGPKVFVGKGTARDRCTSDWDCDASIGLVCLKAWGKDEGKCLVPNLVPTAAACDGEADVCPSDSYCDDQTKVCVPKHAPGESCQPGLIFCMDTAVCAGGGPFGGGCKDKLSLGETCRLDSDCKDGLCEKPTGAPMGACAAELELSPLSSACTGFGS
ncbi:MAG: hypothetical protein ACXWUG_19855 [Polyangiales bacterium]